jgi:hypothetical protein
VDPPINRTAQGGVDPIPFIFLRRFLFHSRAQRSDLATAMLPRPSIQPPVPTKFVLAPPLRAIILVRVCVKTLCHIRSNLNPSGAMAAEGASIPDPRTAWVRSTMTEAKNQALVDSDLL